MLFEQFVNTKTRKEYVHESPARAVPGLEKHVH